MRVVILVGPSGSGKSTYAAGLGPCVVCSADQHFTEMRTGKYLFIPERLADAHKYCLLNVLDSMQSGTPRNVPLVVDNTNCTLVELAPYVALAKAYDHPLEIRAPGVSKEMLLGDFNAAAQVGTWADRNTHGVPVAGVATQWANLRGAWQNWPRFWPALICAGEAK